MFQRWWNSEKKKTFPLFPQWFYSDKRGVSAVFEQEQKKLFPRLKKRYFLGSFTVKRRCLTCLSMVVFPPLKQKMFPNG